MSDLPQIVGQHDEQLAAEAHSLHESIVDNRREIENRWIAMAGQLWEFERIEGWKKLGIESKGDWLADPDVNIEHKTYYALVDIYDTLVRKQGVSVEELKDLHYTKLQAVLAPVRRGQVSPQKAIADVRVMPRSDLREEYGKLPPTRPRKEAEKRELDPDQGPPERVPCPTCGTYVSPHRIPPQ